MILTNRPAVAPAQETSVWEIGTILTCYWQKKIPEYPEEMEPVTKGVLIKFIRAWGKYLWAMKKGRGSKRPIPKAAGIATFYEAKWIDA